MVVNDFFFIHTGVGRTPAEKSEVFVEDAVRFVVCP